MESNSTLKYLNKYNYGEIVDVKLNADEVFAGIVKSIRGSKIIISIVNNDNLLIKEQIYDFNSSNILKLWNIGKKLCVYNRIDYFSKIKNCYLIGFVKHINDELILIKNNIINEEITYVNNDIGKKIFEPEKFSKFNNVNNSNIFEIINNNINNNNNKYDNKESLLNNYITKNFIKNKINIANDNNQIKFNYLNEYIEHNQSQNNKQFCIFKTTPDGNCLYRALSHQIYKNEDYYKTVKSNLLEYILINKNFYKDFIVGGIENIPLYIKIKNLEGVWGDNIELHAFYELYDVNIDIYESKYIENNYNKVSTSNYFNFKLIKSFSKNPNKLCINNNDNVISTINLLYINNEHYDSLINNFINNSNTIFDVNYVGTYERKKLDTIKSNIINKTNNNEITIKSNIPLNKKDINTTNFESVKTNNINNIIYDKVLNSKLISSNNVINKEVKNNDFDMNDSIQTIVDMGFSLEDAVMAYSFIGSDVDLMLQYIYSMNYK